MGLTLVVGCGLVGSRVAELLADRTEVACADADPRRAARLAARLGARTVPLDIGQWRASHDTLARLAPSVVVHAAGRLRADTAELARDLVTDTAGGAFTLAHAAAECTAARLVLVSSLAVYGRAGVGPLAECAPRRPASAYGAAKVAAEAAVLAATEDTGTAPVVLRLSGVVGGVPTPGGGRLNAALFRKVAAHLSGRPVHIDAGFGGREYLDVTDAARVVVAAAERAGPGSVYNVGTGRPLAVRDVAAAFEEIGAAVTADPDGPQPSWWLAVDRAERELGVRPRAPLAQVLAGWVEQLPTREAG